MTQKIIKNRILISLLILCIFSAMFSNLIITLFNSSVKQPVYAQTVESVNDSELTNDENILSKENDNDIIENNIFLVDENVSLITDTYHFASDSIISISFFVTSSSNIKNFTFESQGFSVVSVDKSALNSNQIDIALVADVTTEVNHYTLNIELLSGNILIANLYGITSEYGIYISSFSEDDARDKYLIDLKDNGLITQEEYEDIIAELSRRGVVEESYTILPTTVTRSTSENTYVKGNLQWIDDNNVSHPIRRVMIRIYDNDVFGNIHIGTVYSDNNGDYLFAFSNEDSFWDGDNSGSDIFIRVYPGDNNAIVKRGDGSNEYYYESEKNAHMDVATGSTTVLNLSIDMQTDWGKAFQISQAIMTAQDFAWNMMGEMPSSVTIRYPYDSGCYYSRSSKIITITGNSAQPGQPDSYASWDVIMHEYGHHIQYDMGIIDSPGGSHNFYDNLADNSNKSDGIRLAYSEAWATCFGSIAQRYYSNYLTNISTTNNNEYNSYNGAYINYETSSARNGEACEGSILAVLWDIYDSGTEINDTIALGYKAWWDVSIEGGSKTLSSFIGSFYNKHPNYKDDIGTNLSYYHMAPSKVNSYTTDTTLTLSPPTFNWSAQGGSTYFPNNHFELKIYSADTSSSLVNTSATNYTLTSSQWNTVLAWPGDKINVAVTGYQTSGYPATGGYESEYREYTKPIYTTSTTDGKVTITGTLCQLPGNIVIPSTLNGKPVVAIGAQAFKNQVNLTGITLPSSITSIGNRAFQFCYKLATVNMSSTSVTRIEDYTFDTCAITSISLPNTLTYIGEGVFIRAGNIQTLPNSVTTIGDYAFAYTTINSFVLPTTVTDIGMNAFYGCNSLTVYTSITSKPSTWNINWNSSNRPVVWGCALSSGYVSSFNKTSTNPENSNAINGIANPYRSGYNFEGWFTTSNLSGTQYMNINLAPNGMLYAKWTRPSCISEGSLITLADGSQIAVELLTGDEMLLVWNLKTGSFDTAPILFIDSDPSRIYEVVNLYFSDGTTVKVISEHAFWDINLNKYVFLRNDAAQYIGHWFNKQTVDANGNMTWKAVQLTNVVVANEITTAWSPVTAEHLCYYVNGMLSMPGGTTGLINIFEVDSKTMQYDQEAMQADIAEYGLFTYEEFAELIPVPQEIFDAFDAQYFKVAIGKGLITMEDITELVERYSEFFTV